MSPPAMDPGVAAGNERETSAFEPRGDAALFVPLKFARGLVPNVVATSLRRLSPEVHA